MLEVLLIMMLALVVMDMDDVGSVVMVDGVSVSVSVGSAQK